MIDENTGEVITPFLRTPYNYDRDRVSRETGLECKDETLTQQQFKEDADINTIVERFGLTGQLPENVKVPQYGDFDGITDFQSAMNVVRMGEEAFAEMPANVRERFANDPGKFLEFVHDPENLAEARKLGIANPEAAKTETKPSEPPTDENKG